jgi:hypothetical protein
MSAIQLDHVASDENRYLVSCLDCREDSEIYLQMTRQFPISEIRCGCGSVICEVVF